MTRIPVHCACEGQPLLAYCGLDATGQPWVHVKAYKQQKLITEVISFGDTKIRCRKCRRWFTLRIVKGAPKLEQLAAPLQTG